MKCWHLAGALTALPSSQHEAELALEEELSCPRTVPALPGWRGKQTALAASPGVGLGQESTLVLKGCLRGLVITEVVSKG